MENAPTPNLSFVVGNKLPLNKCMWGLSGLWKGWILSSRKRGVQSGPIQVNNKLRQYTAELGNYARDIVFNLQLA